MLKQCIISVYLLLFSLIAFQVAAVQSDVDPKLEQQLDQYLELAAKDKEASTAMLNQLFTVASGAPALQSRARLLGYLTTNQQLAIQSQRDPLTGLYNRRALHKFMEGRTKNRRENDKNDTLSGILMLDIDFFKRINDHYGHSAGDAVLIEVSKRLLDSCREQDLVVRWGGEEILLLLNNISLAKMPVFIKRILDQLAQTPVQYEQHSINITVSGGFIHLPFSGVNEQQLDWEKIMQVADMALYLSKANGRNQVCMVNSLTVEFERAKTLLYSDLSSAIRKEMVAITTISGTKGNVS